MKISWGSYSIRVQLIALFASLGFFSILSFCLIIWYNDKVESHREYLQEIDELADLSKDIDVYYSANHFDVYLEKEHVRNFSFLLNDLGVKLLGDVEKAIMKNDSLLNETHIHRLQTRESTILYIMDLWGTFENNQKHLEALDNNRSFNFTRDTFSIKYEPQIFIGTDSIEKTYFRKVETRSSVLSDTAKIAISKIHLSLSAVHSELLELELLVQKDFNFHTERYHMVLYIVTVFDTFILFLAYLFVWKRVLIPLKFINSQSQSILKKGFEEVLIYNEEDEIKKLVDVINVLIVGIRRSILYIDGIRNKSIDINFSVDDNQDETLLIGELRGLHRELNDIERKEAQRNWIIKGQAQFVDLLNKHSNDYGNLVDEIIKNVVKYIGALQGALFVLNRDSEETHMELISVYAYDRKKYLSGKVSIGEGIVGQVWKEEKSVFFKEIPANHVSISSGLGDAPPNCLMVCPLMDNGIVYGVIELASFKKIGDLEIEFVERIGENLAATLATAEINKQTQNLLKESQNLAEKMRLQEEEMLQNLKELTSTQEELKLREIQKETEKRELIESYEVDLNRYKERISQLEINIKDAEGDRFEQLTRQLVKALGNGGGSTEEIESVKEKYEVQIADLQESLKIKDMRIDKMRKKIAKLSNDSSVD